MTQLPDGREVLVGSVMRAELPEDVQTVFDEIMATDFSEAFDGIEGKKMVGFQILDDKLSFMWEA